MEKRGLKILPVVFALTQVAPGTAVLVEGLRTNDTYVFGIAAYDEAGNVIGGLGNSSCELLAVGGAFAKFWHVVMERVIDHERPAPFMCTRSGLVGLSKSSSNSLLFWLSFELAVLL